jgi:hypothetical protein
MREMTSDNRPSKSSSLDVTMRYLRLQSAHLQSKNSWTVSTFLSSEPAIDASSALARSHNDPTAIANKQAALSEVDQTRRSIASFRPIGIRNFRSSDTPRKCLIRVEGAPEAAPIAAAAAHRRQDATSLILRISL